MNTPAMPAALAAEDFRRARLLPLALGSFAIGTEAFMIAPLLPALAADLGVGVPAAGQLVTVFACVYGIGSPVLTALVGALDRRRLLLACLALFMLGNLAGALAGSFALLMAARVLMALAAGLYMPNANATATQLVGPAFRGRALAVIAGGQSLAIALGVPVVALLGDRLGWRMSFAVVALLAALGVAALLRLDRVAPAGGAPSLGARLALLRAPGLARACAVTLLWAVGAYLMLTYLAQYLADVLGVGGATVGLFMGLWGIASASGVFLSGGLADRLGAPRVIAAALALLALAFATLGLLAWLKPGGLAGLLAVSGAIVVWGLSVWGFFPAQQARLIGLAGIAAAPVVLSLNASFMYLGFSLGAGLGGLVLARFGSGALGWAAAGVELGALVLAVARGRR
ncbi:MFS transporter [Derxia gummosa]|uniref:MFS transporter n=1 Tax=Derxia gummosa DSM 723 TaxID=1121388 RepID=A0A8B6X8E5_9BURK|nr:MFS transporter [Derxia gummosa]